MLCTALPGPHARDCCRNGCGELGYLARYIHTNGTTAIRWVCDWCEDFKTAGDLPHGILGGVSLGDLPLRQDNSLEPRNLPPCVVCGDEAWHNHHWAPRSIFPEWPDGLTVNLCIPHHDEWHKTMREHGLRWPHELVPA